MGKEAVKTKVLQVVSDIFPDIDTDNIDLSAELTNEYGVNSVSIIQLIVALEREFDIEFEDSELALGLYYDMNDVITAVEAKVQ